MDEMIKECDEIFKSLENIPFDKALPVFQERLWDVAEKYGLTGPELLCRYMGWKYSQK